MIEFFIGLVLMPIFQLLMWFGGFFNSKINTGFESRKSKPWLNIQPDTRPIVIHCSSGEFEYAKPLLRELRSRFKHIPLHVSYFSPTYEKNIRATHEVDFCYPSPWENPVVIRQFLKHHKPRAYMVSRTDAWPVMLSQCRKMGIPTVLFSATLSKNSKRLANPLSRFLARWILKKVDDVFCVTNEDQEMFKKLGVDAKVIGDSRYDQVLYRIKNPKALKSQLKPSQRDHVIVCGSTWAEDELVLVQAAKSTQSKWKWIFAPHEPSPKHLEDLELQLTDAKISFQRYSASENWNTDVLIIDQVGILADLYAWGSVAFVGGSFKKTVHSVMEPLAHGCWTFVGPKHENNREAVLFQSLYAGGNSAVRIVSNAEELAQQMKDLMPATSEIMSLVQKQSGTTAKLVQELSSKGGALEFTIS
jgi:3-deoxy-D-manno-octulosonic-acid transferase